jgi:hypothetical protein
MSPVPVDLAFIGPAFRKTDRLSTYVRVVSDDLSDDQLIAEIRRIEAERKAGRARTGRLLAALYARGGHSWPAIARLTGIRQTTAYDLARPYLLPDPGAET